MKEKHYSVEPMGDGHFIVISSDSAYLGKLIERDGGYAVVLWNPKQRDHAPSERMVSGWPQAGRALFEDYCHAEGHELPTEAAPVDHV